MSRLLRDVITAHHCRSTHHFIAFDALSLIAGDEDEAWKSLFLVHHEHLLKNREMLRNVHLDDARPFQADRRAGLCETVEITVGKFPLGAGLHPAHGMNDDPHLDPSETVQ